MLAAASGNLAESVASTVGSCSQMARAHGLDRTDQLDLDGSPSYAHPYCAAPDHDSNPHPFASQVIGVTRWQQVALHDAHLGVPRDGLSHACLHLAAHSLLSESNGFGLGFVDLAAHSGKSCGRPDHWRNHTSLGCTGQRLPCSFCGQSLFRNC